MRSVTVLLLALALGSSAVLLGLDASGEFRQSDARRVISALPLIAIALACLAFHATWTPEPLDLLKRTLLSAAFLFWAANELFPAAGVGTRRQRQSDRALRSRPRLILWSDLRERFVKPAQ